MGALIWILAYVACEVLPGTVYACLFSEYARYPGAILYSVAMKYDIHRFVPLPIDILLVLLHSFAFAIFLCKWLDYKNNKAMERGKLEGVNAMFPECTKGYKYKVFAIHGLVFFAQSTLSTLSDVHIARISYKYCTDTYLTVVAFLALTISHIVLLVIANRMHNREMNDRQAVYDEIMVEENQEDAIE